MKCAVCGTTSWKRFGFTERRVYIGERYDNLCKPCSYWEIRFRQSCPFFKAAGSCPCLLPNACPATEPLPPLPSFPASHLLISCRACRGFTRNPEGVCARCAREGRS